MRNSRTIVKKVFPNSSSGGKRKNCKIRFKLNLKNWSTVDIKSISGTRLIPDCMDTNIAPITTQLSPKPHPKRAYNHDFNTGSPRVDDLSDGGLYVLIGGRLSLENVCRHELSDRFSHAIQWLRIAGEDEEQVLKGEHSRHNHKHIVGYTLALDVREALQLCQKVGHIYGLSLTAAYDLKDSVHERHEHIRHIRRVVPIVLRVFGTSVGVVVLRPLVVEATHEVNESRVHINGGSTDKSGSGVSAGAVAVGVGRGGPTGAKTSA
jgi:hypothetical protein